MVVTVTRIVKPRSVSKIYSTGLIGIRDRYTGRFGGVVIQSVNPILVLYLHL